MYFILLLGGLVFFHEFGHFIVARMCGVRVLTFSLGFGPGWTVYKSPKSGTDYRLSILPLGGYVKMLGEDPTMELTEGEMEGAFSSKPLWQRTLIVAAGPVFNLILPIFIFFFLGASADKLAPAEVGMVLDRGPAWEAGLREGDQIVAIDGEEVRYWWQLHRHVGNASGEPLKFQIQRGDETLDAVIRPQLFKELRVPALGLTEERGQIRIGAEYMVPVVYAEPGSAAAEAGLKSWDWVQTANGKPIEKWSTLRNLFAANSGKVSLQVVGEEDWFDAETGRAREGLEDLPTREVVLTSAGADKALQLSGVFPAERFVREVEEEGPATRLTSCPSDCSMDQDCAVGMICGRGNQCVSPCSSDKECFGGGRCEVGQCTVEENAITATALQTGDEVTGFNGKRLQRWHQLIRASYEDPKRMHRLHLRRQGETRLEVGCLLPEERTIRNEFNSEEPQVAIGVSNRSYLKRPEPVENKDRLAYGIHRALWDTWDATKVNLYAVAGLFTGNVPVKQLGGPIFIGQLAAKTEERGAQWFFGIMIMLSINLGLLNLLPVPMLDGGHLFFFAIEGITRKPVSIRIRQAAAYVGLSFIILLMLMVFKNDLERVLGAM